MTRSIKIVKGARGSSPPGTVLIPGIGRAVAVAYARGLESTLLQVACRCACLPWPLSGGHLF